MTEPRAMVRNASDRKQVEEAKKKEKLRKTQEREDLRTVLALPAGRRFLWRLLEHCKVFGSVWHASALIHYNSGIQDVGHFLMEEIEEADRAAFLLMINERQPKEIEDDGDNEPGHRAG